MLGPRFDTTLPLLGYLFFFILLFYPFLGYHFTNYRSGGDLLLLPLFRNKRPIALISIAGYSADGLEMKGHGDLDKLE
jgi:hypothetical protein